MNEATVGKRRDIVVDRRRRKGRAQMESAEDELDVIYPILLGREAKSPGKRQRGQVCF